MLLYLQVALHKVPLSIGKYLEHFKGLDLSLENYLCQVWWYVKLRSHMDVSENRGTPKSSILIWFSII